MDLGKDFIWKVFADLTQEIVMGYDETQLPG
jgi:hypothetical protein